MAKICFIVGHGKGKSGGYDPGATNGDYHEFKIAREIARYAQEYYNKYYSEVADLMNYNGSLNLNDRIKKVNTDKYDFIAEIHLNSSKSKTATGTECYYHHGSKRGQLYADTICDNISAALGVTQRPNGTDKDGGDKIKLNDSGTADYFGIIRSTKPCAVLVETVFISNTFDLARIKTTEGQIKCGEAIAKAVASCRGLIAVKPNVVVAKPTTPVKPTTTSKYFAKYDGKSNSLVDALKAIKINSAYSYRKKIAKANGIKLYIGSAKQNTQLLALLKSGKLIKP